MSSKSYFLYGISYSNHTAHSVDFFPSTHVSYPSLLRLHCRWLSLGNNPFVWAGVPVITVGSADTGKTLSAMRSCLLRSGDCSDCFPKTSVSSFNPMRTLWSRRYYLHFPDQETETKVICPRSHSQDSNAGHLAPESMLSATRRLLAGSHPASLQRNRAGATKFCTKHCSVGEKHAAPPQRSLPRKPDGWAEASSWNRLSGSRNSRITGKEVK